MAETHFPPTDTDDRTDADGGCVAVDRVRADGSTLLVDLSASGRVEQYLTDEPLKIHYPESIASVPEEILVVPALAQLCPVAWAVGADVVVDRVDSEFLVALHRVQESLRGLYPSFMEGGDIRSDTIVSPRDCEVLTGDSYESSDISDRSSALLFSGGVDSLASYIRRRKESPLLVSVQGWVVDDGDEWRHVQNHISNFASRHGCETAFLRSNMLSVLDTALLNAQFKPHLGGSWYAAVGHGLGLLGLCAPLCYRRGIDTLYIAATHSDSFTEPWGSHPSIDDSVSWSGTAARHDGYDMTRQDKIGSIARFVRKHDPQLQIRTCTVDAGNGGNCSECEKCYRTIAGLVIAGVDPRDHGYRVSEVTFPDIRRGLASGRWILAADEQFMWEDLQAAAPAESPLPFPGAGDFYAWLTEADIEQLVAQSNPPLRDRLLRGLARHSPHQLYRSLYPLYSRIQRVLP